MNRPIIGLTMGDPAGIGPEVILKSLAQHKIHKICRPIVIGDANTIRHNLGILNLDIEIRVVSKVNEAHFAPRIVNVFDLMNVDLHELEPGITSGMAGKAAVEAITKAVELSMKKEIDAIATAPLNKEAMFMAGYKYPGHTEILADLTQTKDFSMMLVTENLKVIHVSTHVSLAEAITRVKTERIRTVIQIAQDTLTRMKLANPKIAVAGLNPHASEGGLFGNEELAEIIPAIEDARKSGIQVSGPYPPDTVFYRASKGEFDIVVVMYHDQGHIPIKLMGFDTGVNVTVGLPIIRTSVDHGTAFDIAYQGKADESSMIEAIELAAKMVE